MFCLSLLRENTVNMSYYSVPDLSVIIASYNSRRTIEACLRSLERQVTDKRIEVILVDTSSDGTAKLVQEKFPLVRLYCFNQRKYCGDARNFGISLSRANIIAFLDSDCTVDPDWAEKVFSAHHADHLLVGGVIDNGQSRDMVGWAYYFCEYSLWMPTLHRRGPREIKEIAGCCLSMKRDAFTMYGPFLKGTYSSDTAFQWKLSRDGHKVLQDPTIKVYHTADYGFKAFLSHVFTHRKHFAGVMVKSKRLSGMYRTALVLGTPLFPLILYLIILTRVFRSKNYRKELLLSSPILIAGLLARTWGEFVGLAGRKHKERY